VVRLHDHGAALAPVRVQRADHVLEVHAAKTTERARRTRPSDDRRPRPADIWSMRRGQQLGAAFLALLVILGASLGTESSQAKPSAAACTADGNGSGGPTVAHAGLGVVRRQLKFDGVEATITPQRSATGLSGCDKLGALVAIGTGQVYLVAELYAHARLPDGFVSRYQWSNGGPYYYVAPAIVPSLPSTMRHAHVLRLVRARPSTSWRVEVDGHVVNRIHLPGSSRGLTMPRALLYAVNRQQPLNRGSFRFDEVLVLPAGSRSWTTFPHGKSWLYTDHTKYTYVNLPGRRSFIAKSR
jgi:hypothetical protein